MAKKTFLIISIIENVFVILALLFVFNLFEVQIPTLLLPALTIIFLFMTYLSLRTLRKYQIKSDGEEFEKSKIGIKTN